MHQEILCCSIQQANYMPAKQASIFQVLTKLHITNQGRYELKRIGTGKKNIVKAAKEQLRLITIFFFLLLLINFGVLLLVKLCLLLRPDFKSVSQCVGSAYSHTRLICLLRPDFRCLLNVDLVFCHMKLILLTT